MIEKGREWAEPTGEAPEVRVAGGDAALAGAVEARPGARFAFEPRDSDLARALGLGSQAAADHEVGVDALEVTVGAVAFLAVNMVVIGTAPDRARWWTGARPVKVVVDDRVLHDGPATAVVVANGQFRRGLDLVPEGHPGDGWLEVHVHALPAGRRRAARARLATGTHVPHPGIRTARGRRVEITLERPAAVEADLVARPHAGALTAQVRPGAFRLLV